MGKLIAIAGSDCSGKETQSKLLMKKLEKRGYKACYMHCPDYNQPTGKIIQGPCLAKQGESYFEEGFANVEPKIAGLYYAIDRRYMLNQLKENLKKYDFVIMDRWVESNMAHQGGKIKSKQQREEYFKWTEELEYNMLELPRPALTFFLYMPYDWVIELMNKRDEKKDSVETNETYLKNSENSYLHLAELYHFKKIDCIKNNQLLTKEEIGDQLLEETLNYFNKKEEL
jgi:dTMP kinase